MRTGHDLTGICVAPSIAATSKDAVEMVHSHPTVLQFLMSLSRMHPPRKRFRLGMGVERGSLSFSQLRPAGGGVRPLAPPPATLSDVVPNNNRSR